MTARSLLRALDGVPGEDAWRNPFVESKDLICSPERPCAQCMELDVPKKIRSVPARAEFGHPSADYPVYFVQCELTLIVKIGYARDPWHRLDCLQSACPSPLRLTGVFPYGGKDLEGMVHRAFANDRWRGEWFVLTKQLVNTIHSVVHSWPALNLGLSPVRWPVEG